MKSPKKLRSKSPLPALVAAAVCGLPAAQALKVRPVAAGEDRTVLVPEGDQAEVNTGNGAAVERGWSDHWPVLDGIKTNLLSPLIQIGNMYGSAWKTHASNHIFTASDIASDEAGLLDYLQAQMKLMQVADCIRRVEVDAKTNTFREESESAYVARLNSHISDSCETSANRIIEIVQLINEKRTDTEATFARVGLKNPALKRLKAASPAEEADFLDHKKVIKRTESPDSGFLFKGKTIRSSDDWRTAETIVLFLIIA